MLEENEDIVDLYYDAIVLYDKNELTSAGEKLKEAEKLGSRYIEPYKKFAELGQNKLTKIRLEASKDPTDLQKQLDLAKELALINQNNEALHVLKNIADADPNFFDPNFELGPKPTNNNYIELSCLCIQHSQLPEKLRNQLIAIAEVTDTLQLLEANFLLGVDQSRSQKESEKRVNL